MLDLGFPVPSQTLRFIAMDFKQDLDSDNPRFAQRVCFSKKWVRGFFKRHPVLKRKPPRKIAIQRAMSVTPEVVDKFFAQYTQARENIDAAHTWNLDETGRDIIPVIQSVIGRKGEAAEMIVSGDKGVRSSMVSICSAAGEQFTPMIIHKGLRIQANWYYNAPEGSIIRCSESGYISKQLFLEYLDLWMDHMTETGRGKEQHLLLIDGHSCHTKNFPAIDLMARENVSVLLLPSHGSHKLQPLDKNPFSGFEFWWQVYLERYNRKNAGKPLTKENFWEVFTPAWSKGVNRHTIKVAWMRCGLEPIDRKKIANKSLKSEVFCSKQSETHIVVLVAELLHSSLLCSLVPQ